MSATGTTRQGSADASSAEACIRDMMGMAALPALWAGRSGTEILQVMSEAVSRVVAFDFCFAQVVLQAGQPEYALVQLSPRLAGAPPLDTWTEAARRWRATRTPDGRAFEADTPLGMACIVGLSMGYGTHGGKIWFGARNAGFPTHHQLALLRMATSLAAAGLQAARVNEERDQASRAKDEFLAMLAHELRNPLAPISAAAQLLTMTEPEPERVRKASAVIARQARHMTALIDDLLDVSRVTRGLIVLEQESVDLARVVADAVEQVRPLLDARRHRLDLRLADGPVVVTGDHKRLVQVVSNILNNAAKYTPDGGHVVLRVGVEGGSATVAIADDGIGMSADLVERAFDLFAQAQRSADRAQGGLGLGLALVRSLVELHGGRVDAASAGPGRGSTFTIRLPRIVLAPAREAPGDAPHAAGGAGLRVMLVDDNVDAAQMLARLLDTLGFETRVAHDAGAALACADPVPDVFLLDIGLPGIDGYELARRLRAAPATRSATLVALTGYGAKEDRERAAAAGFDRHFVKPVDLDALVGLFREVAHRVPGQVPGGPRKT